ncbi:hypothetical protein [Flammeovirga aprica]|uniref:Uncharacterized protein n=1 Tax=Flammeovirga aprica JL-4 TaxID=694437 RepID=A0A7X9RUP2_9BACT|nr:hypothetical protein [Flammeovirga aprica]NME68964.1 hypothetical protein [Flammeovirga aprica JL-4]
MKLYFTLLFLIIINTVYAQSKIQKTKKSVKQKKENPHQKVSDDELTNKTAEKVFGHLLRSAMGKSRPSNSTFSTTPNTGYNPSPSSNFSGVPPQTETLTPPLRLLKYPYADGRIGKSIRSFEYPNKSSLLIEGGYYWESDEIRGYNGMLQLNLSPKFSFNARGNVMVEKIDDLQERVDIYHVNGTYHLISENRVDLWIGGGYSTLILDEFISGYNYNMGTELFITKPLSLYFTWHFGTFDEDIKFQEIHCDVRLYIKSFYFKAGFQNTKIVDVGFNGASLGAGIIIF